MRMHWLLPSAVDPSIAHDARCAIILPKCLAVTSRGLSYLSKVRRCVSGQRAEGVNSEQSFDSLTDPDRSGLSRS